MLKFSLLFLCFLGLTTPLLAQESCFLAVEHGNVLKAEGDCKTRYAPASTFKIPLSLMGFDAGILEDETHPVWPFKPGYTEYLNVWKSTPQNPHNWMRDSCVWYSQVLTQKLGMKRFQEYVNQFDYGNRDLSGDVGKDNGLTQAWLSSSLEISPEEQVAFLQKFVDHKLPVSKKAMEMTKHILFREELWGGWKLYGKTGTGLQLTADRKEKTDKQHGWFVGWIEKDGKAICFASHIVDTKKEKNTASFRAKEAVIQPLFRIIEELAKAQNERRD